MFLRTVFFKSLVKSVESVKNKFYKLTVHQNMNTNCMAVSETLLRKCNLACKIKNFIRHRKHCFKILTRYSSICFKKKRAESQ